MISNHIIKSKPNTNLIKLTKTLNKGVFKNIYACRIFKTYEFAFMFQKITTK